MQTFARAAWNSQLFWALMSLAAVIVMNGLFWSQYLRYRQAGPQHLRWFTTQPGDLQYEKARSGLNKLCVPVIMMTAVATAVLGLWLFNL
jgi:hypothetical protein